MPTKKYECEKCGRTFRTDEACEVHEESCNDEGYEETKQEKRKSGGGKLVILLLIVVIVVWGFIGGAVAQDVGVSCDMGIGDTFCWIWHTNYVGQIAEGFNNLLGK